MNIVTRRRSGGTSRTPGFRPPTWMRTSWRAKTWTAWTAVLEGDRRHPREYQSGCQGGGRDAAPGPAARTALLKVRQVHLCDGSKTNDRDGSKLGSSEVRQGENSLRKEGISRWRTYDAIGGARRRERRAASVVPLPRTTGARGTPAAVVVGVEPRHSDGGNGDGPNSDGGNDPVRARRHRRLTRCCR